MDILVLQHHDLEHLSILGDILEERNFSYRYIRLHKNEKIPQKLEDLNEVKGIIILGGPMSVYETNKISWLKDEINLLKKIIPLDFPMFGICLGSQLIATAAGARVYADQNNMEIGWSTVTLENISRKDSLHQKLPGSFKVFQWHGDTFNLPPKAKLLASSELFKNQAFKIGENIYAFQYHMEIKEKDIRNWLKEFSKDLRSSRCNVLPEKIIKDTQIFIKETNEWGKEIFCNWLDLINLERKGL